MTTTADTPTADEPPADRPAILQRTSKSETVDVDQARRTVVSTITTDGVDRCGEVILPRGITLENYAGNRVVLWCHGPGQILGKNLWLKRYTKDGRSGILAKTQFARTDLAQEVFELYAEGFLNGWSIGGHPDWSAAGPPTAEEIRQFPAWKKASRVYRKVDLVEYSGCSVPANPEALGNETGKAISAELRRQIEQAEPWEPRLAAPAPATGPAPETPGVPAATAPEPLPRLLGRTFAEALDQTRRAVRALTSDQAAQRAAQDTIDRARGRV